MNNSEENNEVNLPAYIDRNGKSIEIVDFEEGIITVFMLISNR